MAVAISSRSSISPGDHVLESLLERQARFYLADHPLELGGDGGCDSRTTARSPGGRTSRPQGVGDQDDRVRQLLVEGVSRFFWRRRRTSAAGRSRPAGRSAGRAGSAARGRRSEHEHPRRHADDRRAQSSRYSLTFSLRSARARCGRCSPKSRCSTALFSWAGRRSGDQVGDGSLAAGAAVSAFSSLPAGSGEPLVDAGAPTPVPGRRDEQDPQGERPATTSPSMSMSASRPRPSRRTRRGPRQVDAHDLELLDELGRMPVA